jgi:YegS/Rv2252/BmrU family lipid kinase
MTYIHFIVNPISGKGTHNLTGSFIRNFFSRDKYRIEVEYTQFKGHALELATTALAKKPDILVACGGDGTINEVASCLVHTDIPLGIVPVGSGNGLASNLNIPRDFENAFSIIRHGHTSQIDVGKVNKQYFFSNMGIGIDARIIKKYEKAGKRTLVAYIQAAVKASISYRPREIVLFLNDKEIKAKPFLLFISNSNEMGYTMSLTPKASLSDGWLDLVMVPQISIFSQLLLGYRVLRNQIEKFKPASHTLIERLKIETADNFTLGAQIDGEFHYMKTYKLKISIVKSGLKVLTQP